MKVTRSVENERSLLQGTTRKTTSEERRLLNFLRPLMTTGLPLMKSVLTPLAKNVSLPFGLSAAMSATDAAIQKKKKKRISNFSIDNFKWRNGRYNENS